MPYLADVPIGTIVASILNTKSIPSDWLPCDGSLIPANYQELRTLLGSNNTPNLIGRTLVGAGTFPKPAIPQSDKRDPHFEALNASGTLPLSATGGECTHLLTIAEMPSHGHNINGGNFGLHSRSFQGGNDTDLPFESNPNGQRLYGTDPNGDGGAHYNVQPYYAVTYIIYAGQT